MNAQAQPQIPEARRALDRRAFDAAYDEVVLGNAMFEGRAYYQRYRERYWQTMCHVARIPLPRAARVLEIGGGQIALMMHRLFGDRGTVADVNAQHADCVERFGLEHVVCDLFHDDLPARDEFDLVVLCEVIEHVPRPPHEVLARIRNWIRPGGHLFLTTPNLFRLRNGLRLLLGRPVFCNFFVPQRGQPLGHFLEYSAEQMRWQLQHAGLEVTWVDEVMLCNQGTELAARILRPLLAPLMWLRPRLRENLVALGRRPVPS
ncbi:MAG: hypothetical protein RL148_672 [Planctomycetota bacterium]|jgi:2-polyprenyl-3-methyl-5-hydroxy-6-metoxy-1,4-benzoquinol methylase